MTARNTRSARFGGGRLQAQWLVLAAALTVLAGLVVGWALTDAAERVSVVGVARPISAGEFLEVEDLRISQIAFDAGVTGLVPATSLDALVGRVATIDLAPGTLLSVGMWADDTGLAPGERTVGALLEAGRAPEGLSRGDLALAVAITGAGAARDLVDAIVVPIRILEAAPAETGGLAVTLAVPEGDAANIARLAATDALVLVGVPTAGTPPTVDPDTDTLPGPTPDSSPGVVPARESITEAAAP